MLAGLKFDCARHQDVISSMESAYCYGYEEENGSLKYACFGVFDGHGGTKAVRYMKDHLMKEIVSHQHFFSEQNDLVSIAIKEGFVRAHMKMKEEFYGENGSNTQTGQFSMSGTTVAIAVIRNDKIFIGHVGDSGVVLGRRNPIGPFWQATRLTTAHTPDVVSEHERIERCGGKIAWHKELKLATVVWEKIRTELDDDDEKRQVVDKLSILSISRALGDFWSYNEKSGEFIISPVPDVTIVDINSTLQYLILGTKGLWANMCPNHIVNMVHLAEHSNMEMGNAINSNPNEYNLKKLDFNDLAKTLVRDVLQRWYIKNSTPADNMAVVVIVIPSWFLDKSRNSPCLKSYVMHCNANETSLGEYGKLVSSETTYSISDVMDSGYLQIIPKDYNTPEATFELQPDCPVVIGETSETIIEDETLLISPAIEENCNLNDTNDWDSQIEITSQTSVVENETVKKKKKYKKEPTYPRVFTRRRFMRNFKRATTTITFKQIKKPKK